MVTPAIGHIRRIVTAIAALSLFLAVSSAAMGQDGLATVRVDARAIFRVGPVDSVTATSRAAEIERRISNLLDAPQAIKAARVAADGTNRIVSVARVPIVTVTPADAENNVTTIDVLAKEWADAIDLALERGSARRASGWGRFSADLRASVGTAFARLAESAITIIPRALAAFVVLFLFWLLARGARALMRFSFKRIDEDPTMQNLVRQITYYSIWGLGIIVAVNAAGFRPETVVAGFGLTGLALGFALKDIISNFMSGLIILITRPFQLRDEIAVGDTEGTVERVVLRATHIRTFDGRLVLVPNSEIITARVTNNTAAPVRRATVAVHLAYTADLRHAAQVFERATMETPGVLAQPEVTVRVGELARDYVILESRFWTDSRRFDFVTTQSAVRENVISAMCAAGVRLPDPGVKVVVANQSEPAIAGVAAT